MVDRADIAKHESTVLEVSGPVCNPLTVTDLPWILHDEILRADSKNRIGRLPCDLAWIPHQAGEHEELIRRKLFVANQFQSCQSLTSRQLTVPRSIFLKAPDPRVPGEPFNDAEPPKILRLASEGSPIQQLHLQRPGLFSVPRHSAQRTPVVPAGDHRQLCRALELALRLRVKRWMGRHGPVQDEGGWQSVSVLKRRFWPPESPIVDPEGHRISGRATAHLRRCGTLRARCRAVAGAPHKRSRYRNPSRTGPSAILRSAVPVPGPGSQ